MAPVSIVPDRDSPLRAESSAVAERYVKQRGGTRVIQRVLVANNGMAACKFVRSIRSWGLRTFGTASAIDLIAMCSEDDLQHRAAFVELVDRLRRVPGGPSSINYGNVELIVSLAVEERVDVQGPQSSTTNQNHRLSGRAGAMHQRTQSFLEGSDWRE